MFDEGRGNLGRSPTFHATDLAVYHDFNLPGGMRVNVNANIINLFDQQIVTRNFTTRYRDAMTGITDAQFFQGINPEQIIIDNRLRFDPRFNLSDQYQGARSFRLQAKLMF